MLAGLSHSIGYEGSVALLQNLALVAPSPSLDCAVREFGYPARTVDLSLDSSLLFRKIVLSRRGGSCVELNSLFALLLEQLGFSVTRLAARVLNGAEGVRPWSHQLLLVQIGDSPWMADVGFGANGL